MIDMDKCEKQARGAVYIVWCLTRGPIENPESRASVTLELRYINTSVKLPCPMSHCGHCPSCYLASLWESLGNLLSLV